MPADRPAPEPNPAATAAASAAAPSGPAPATAPEAPTTGDAAPETSAAPGGGLELRLDVLRKLNLAVQQNGLPAVTAVTAVNHGETTLRGVALSLRADPPFFTPKTLPPFDLAPGEETTFLAPELELDFTFLSTLAERAAGRVTATAAAPGGAPLAPAAEAAVEIFPADQWLGIDTMPDLVCAFVTPNMEIIAALLAEASRLLQEETGNGSLNGYQSRDPQRVYQTCAAIYRAVAAWELSYSMPPASFASGGQRVRFADSIYKFRMGTCLDTTLLFASAFEQCGLNPVVMFCREHAFVGCHLADYYFPDVPADDLQAIRKRIAAEEFVAIETTASAKMSFGEAEAKGKQECDDDEAFECAIDVRRARLGGVLPLPLKSSVEGLTIEPVTREARERERERLRELRQPVDLSALAPGAAPADPRLARWQQKLLDLSLRNRLLNARDGKQLVPIIGADLAHLEDALADDAAFTVGALSKLGDFKELTPEAQKLLSDEQRKKRLWSPLEEKDLQRRLLEIYRQSRTDIEEGGVNTLFLALGFLHWGDKRKTYRAPLLLLPLKLERPTVGAAVKFARFDEEMLLNVTLLEMLRREFHLPVPGLEPLPADDHGVNVALVMDIFRAAVKSAPGFEVREEAVLGLFSFNKFIMWNDLARRAADLKHNPLVAHLIDGGGAYDDGVAVFPPEKLEDNLDVADLYCPLAADASQLAAVRWAALGKSFVLHGPPGTGKSQTIANLIADNLARGRKVLFVSEKKAALDVVHRRLSKIGLKPFCLELHANKGGKAEVARQFREALEFSGAKPPAAWAATVGRLRAVRDELRGYVEDLHRVYPNGLTPYRCFAKLLAAGREKLPRPGLVEYDCLTQTAEGLTAARLLLNETVAAFGYVPAKARALFAPLGVFDHSPAAEAQLRSAATAAAERADALAAALRGVLAGLAPEAPTGLGAGAAAAIAEFLAVLGRGPALPPALLAGGDGVQTGRLRELCKAGREAGRLREKTLKSYRPEALSELDCEGLGARLAANAERFFVIRFFRDRALAKELSGLRRPGAAPLTAGDLRRDLPAVAALQRAEKNLADGKGDAAALGELWQGERSDWDAIEQALAHAGEVARAAGALRAALPETLRDRLWPALAAALPQNGAAFAAGGADAPRAAALQREAAAFNAAASALAAAAHCNPAALAAQAEKISLPGGVKGLPAYAALARAMAAGAGELRRVCLWKKQRAAAAAAGMEGLMRELESGKVAAEDAAGAFVNAYYALMLEQALAAAPRLRDFMGPTQDARVQSFRELDAAYTALSRDMAVAKIAATMPTGLAGKAAKNSELGILRHECEKKTRHKPVRRLLEAVPALAAQLKPCFLMSPLSVAQFLPPDGKGFADFDLVVFDEASQIPVWDAIGAIARGKQLIVVGDQKQMPPTSFFQKGDDESDADEGGAEDLESVLDECIAAGVPSSYLRWHYRSRHESLIAFSNRHYYEGRLFTFPAAADRPWLGVKHVFVPDSPYARSKRVNEGEARALVAHVVARLQNPETADKSIGVVTFSQAQRELIEDLMEEARAAHPELEKYFSDEAPEPLFVKNLENVQGDERDVILFSIGYAPDAHGKFFMNFGPLNRQGGERRLNVAITRAKEQVIVFASVSSTRIDLGRTGATGAAHLKAFLEYAERAGAGGVPATAAAKEEKVFAPVVAAFLRERGFDVATDVGCSAYRVDVAVRHPRRPGEYVLGVECDGAAYRDAVTVRDREETRAGVLQGLGWNLHRAWIVEWWHDPEVARAKLLKAVEDALRAADATGAANPNAAAPTPAPRTAPTSASEPANAQGAAAAPAPFRCPVCGGEYPPAAKGENDARPCPDCGVVHVCCPECGRVYDKGAVMAKPAPRCDGCGHLFRLPPAPKA